VNIIERALAPATNRGQRVILRSTGSVDLAAALAREPATRTRLVYLDLSRLQVGVRLDMNRDRRLRDYLLGEVETLRI
jgi:hypothetical protein